jgi:hypothetical protein
MVVYVSFYVFSKIIKFRSKSIGVSFIVNHQVEAKTDRISVFLGCDPLIPDRVYIMVPYMRFYGFSKLRNYRSKSIVVSLGFTVNRQLPTKTDRNSIFHSRDPHILDWLYIMVPYMSFFGF